MMFGEAKESWKLKISDKGEWKETICRSDQLGLLIMYKVFELFSVVSMGDQWWFIIYKPYIKHCMCLILKKSIRVITAWYRFQELFLIGCAESEIPLL